jgi:LacI family transcriptional regulator
VPVRLKDIAHDLGVSVVTVSKVLRNHTDIGAATRERVLKRVRELGYRPDLTARALVTGRTGLLGMVVPDLVHPFFAQVAEALARTLRPAGYSLVIASSGEDPELEREEIAHLTARRVDAILVASARPDATVFKQLDSQKTRFILLDRRFDGFTAHFVGIDNERAGGIATDHLVAQGCRRIAHIPGPPLSPAAGRLSGYRKALARHGLAAPRGLVTERTGDVDGDAGGYVMTRRLLALKPRPDGIFCYNDPIAAGAIRAIFEAGLRIPQDVAVIGCGDVRYAEMLRVPLSSINQDSTGTGEQAAKLALDLIASKEDVPTRTVLLEPRLVARASSLRRG